MAVQDLQLSSDWPGSLIVYHYHPTPPVGIYELPEGQRIFGIVKKWSKQMASGLIAVNGTGPDIPITGDTLEDVVTLIPGAPVLFSVWHQSAEGMQYRAAVIWRCIGDRETVKTKLSANFGSETAMRNFARNLQQKLQLGSPDI